ncbi:hypothetical protein B2G71_22035 [Novosphingobium sp. PC22D]|uniref:hypothetical protein n=1 Tax=Novosphingobium sp. PC22D TaxID=1962403 RepID=UPI000BF0A2B1|nr:hypothetical protein [Novosphingobium sp. PC22D]PEQ10508.1 hypothetical protein B2G71_22035 [Novosphingobium sp. PC22D]
MIEVAPEKLGFLREQLETPEFTGHVVWALYNDPDLPEISGKTQIGAELAVKYGIVDKEGRRPPSYRDTHSVVPFDYYPLITR